MLTRLERSQIRSRIRSSNLDARWRSTVTSMLNALDSFEENHSWTRCVDKLPDDATDVLVLMRAPDGESLIAIASRREDLWVDPKDETRMDGVTHWIPLPSLPLPEKEWLR